MCKDNAKIPKVIHYIWLGDKQPDKVSLKCMKTWENILPEYKVMRWGDDECKSIILSNTYAKQSYEAGKYAFTSDYLRLYILYNYGGIYMDTDVEVIKSLDIFLNNEAFTSFENTRNIPTALMASTKGNEWIGMLLSDYDNRLFIDKDGKMDLETNVDRITALSKSWGFVPNGKEQVLKSMVHIYPKEYFCPLDTMNKNNDVFTANTYAVHLFNNSWNSLVHRKLSKIKKTFGIDPKKILGKKFYNFLKRV